MAGKGAITSLATTPRQQEISCDFVYKSVMAALLQNAVFSHQTPPYFSHNSDYTHQLDHLLRIAVLLQKTLSSHITWSNSLIPNPDSYRNH